jgi:endo-1,4-beta-xylanase
MINVVRRTSKLPVAALGVGFAIWSCGADPSSTPGNQSAGSAGVSTVAGSATGFSGTSNAAGSGSSGASTTGGVASVGGSSSVSGSSSVAGSSSVGGSSAVGGSSGSGGGGNGSGGNSTGGNSGGSAGAAGAGGSSGAPSCSGPPLSGGTPHCSSNAQGNIGSYSWTIWSSGSGGCITPYGVGAAFKATWNNSGDFLARVGLGLGSNKTYDKFGPISADFAETKSGSAGGYSYVGIYGWSVNPLIEYYIVDDWFSGRPNPGGTKMGTLTVDDGTYDIYKHQQVNQPSIQGNQTFDQFFSVRQTARSCGHISITEHFKKWAELGLKLGNLEEARVLVEAGGGVGSIDFTKATLTAQ